MIADSQNHSRIVPDDAVLLVIDMQKAIDMPEWGVRNNPDAEKNVRRLQDAWRTAGRPLVHVRHDSRSSDSTYRPGQPGHDFKPETAPLPGETVIGKVHHSAFAGTGLEERLKSAGQTTVFVCGVITNNSVEATVRHANNLGFNVYLIEDACFTFGKTDWHRRAWSADEVHALSVANMSGEYCEVVGTAEVAAGGPVNPFV